MEKLISFLKRYWAHISIAAVFFVLAILLNIFFSCTVTPCGSVGDARKVQSDSYWRGEARPFAIVEHAQSNDQLVAIAMNVESEPTLMKYFAVGSSSNTTEVSFSGGEKKQISIAMSEKCKPGSTYELNVSFGFDDGKIQKGAKNLFGKCA
jgi:hypothetical protein